MLASTSPYRPAPTAGVAPSARKHHPKQDLLPQRSASLRLRRKNGAEPVHGANRGGGRVCLAAEKGRRGCGARVVDFAPRLPPFPSAAGSTEKQKRRGSRLAVWFRAKRRRIKPAACTETTTSAGRGIKNETVRAPGDASP